MPPKKRIPTPIDRPLSRAYLRQFSGWATELPPGISDPTSLRVMENLLVEREGAVSIRPGLRYLSFDPVSLGQATDRRLVGSIEPFFLANGNKAYLFAVREEDNEVGFRVMTESAGVNRVLALDDPLVGFSIPQGYSALPFTADTTYVSYLQIDNKIFALSNAGETLRLFEVGTSKKASRPNEITRPVWSIADKLSVVEPDAGWIDDTLPSAVRYNYVRNPNFEYSLTTWKAMPDAERSRSDNFAESGTWSLRVESTPEQINVVPNPLRNVGLYGFSGWSNRNMSSSLVANGIWLQGTINSGAVGRTAAFVAPRAAVKPGESYGISWAGFVGSGTSGVQFIDCRFYFYSAGGAQIGDPIDKTVTYVPSGPNPDRWVSNGKVTVPEGAATMEARCRLQVDVAAARTVRIGSVMISETGWGGYLDGSMGSEHYWGDNPDESPSYYHPPKDVEVYADDYSSGDGPNITLSVSVYSPAEVRDVSLGIRQYNSSHDLIDSDYGTGLPTTVGAWTRFEFTAAQASGQATTSPRIKLTAVPHHEYHYIDAVLLEDESAAGDFFDGDTTDTSTTTNTWGGAVGESVSQQIVVTSALAIPIAESRTTNTLISSTAADNVYNFGLFYTFSNEVGETAPSQVTVVKTQRAWPSWRWETPNGLGEPSGVETLDPDACADQLVAILPESVFDAAVAENAQSWSLYLVTWSDQDPVPVQAVKVAERQLSLTATYESVGWARVTPQQVGIFGQVVPLPNVADRVNYTIPARAGQGIVAADRMTLVLDPTEQALIRWSSNQQGFYTDFTAVLGGGRKTLTSGNLFIPACVKLWQNPQSVDTLTILCMGTDGRSTGYYMAPSTISSQSEAVTVMGFEETTATPGTTSPFGCEVWNNALYHPLDDQLMKSTANNYNINHKSMTEMIAKNWSSLLNKETIGSSQHDGRLYYIVHNPRGEELLPGARGNEVWVLDAQAKIPTWSRWLVQAVSLKPIEQHGQLFMSVVRPDGIYYFDPLYGLDDYVDVDGMVQSRPIPWRLETNTQGANRAHDAWCHLQQISLTLGNFVGSMKFGLRSWNLHGKPVELTKEVRANAVGAGDPEIDSDLPFDIEEILQVRHDLQQWILTAGSIEENGSVLPSFGQISVVQYRYTPSSVNTGYEFGSVETFEYHSRGLALEDRTSHNGVPIPYTDTRRP